MLNGFIINKNLFALDHLEQRILLSADPLSALFVDSLIPEPEVEITPAATQQQTAVVEVTMSSEQSDLLQIDNSQFITASDAGSEDEDLLFGGLLDAAPVSEAAGTEIDAPAGVVDVLIGAETNSNTASSSGLAVNGNGQTLIEGQLHITLAQGFAPEVGQVFEILTFDSALGQFEQAQGLFGFGDGSLYLKIVQTGDSLQLVVTQAFDGMSFASDDVNINVALGHYLNQTYFGSQSTTYTALEADLEINQFGTVSGLFDVSFEADKMAFSALESVVVVGASGLAVKLTGTVIDGLFDQHNGLMMLAVGEAELVGNYGLQINGSLTASVNTTGQLGSLNHNGEWLDLEAGIQVQGQEVALIFEGYTSAEGQLSFHWVESEDGTRLMVLGDDLNVTIGQGSSALVSDHSSLTLALYQQVEKTGYGLEIKGQAKLQTTADIDLLGNYTVAINTTGTNIFERIGEQVIDLGVALVGAPVQLTEASLRVGESLHLVGDISLSIGQDENLEISGQALNSVLGAGDVQLLISTALAALFVTSEGSYALTVTGAMALAGAAGVSLNSRGSVRVNTTGRAVQKTISGVEIAFSNGSHVDSVSARDASLVIANYANLTGDFNFQAMAPPAEFGLQIVAQGQAILNNQTIITEASSRISLTNQSLLVHIDDGDQVYTWIGQGAALGGTGSTNLHLVNDGNLTPGHSPGIQTLASLTQTAGATLDIEIGGTTAGPGSVVTDDGYDQVNVSGTAILDGSLTVTLLNNFTPTVGQVFNILTFGSVSGKFSAANGLFGFGDGSLYFELVQQSDRLQLVVRQLPVQLTVADVAVQKSIGLLLNIGYFADTISASLSFDANFNLANMVYVNSSFSLAYGGLSTASLVDLDGNVTTKEVRLFSLGAAQVNLFFGVHGPADQDGAVGLSIQQANFAWALLLPTSANDSASYYGLRATSTTVALVGVEGLSLSVNSLELGLNGSNNDSQQRVVDFTQGDLDGDGDSDGVTRIQTSASTFLDLTHNSSLAYAQGDLTLVVSDFVSLSGTFRFEMQGSGVAARFLVSGRNISVELTAGSAKLSINNGSLGMLINSGSNAGFALQAKGDVALSGVDGLTIGGTLGVDVNT
ncbi:MAG: LEPR-XLL domain-containing protein, partial [Gammaproteobacteria bacterium]